MDKIRVRLKKSFSSVKIPIGGVPAIFYVDKDYYLAPGELSGSSKYFDEFGSSKDYPRKDHLMVLSNNGLGGLHWLMLKLGDLRRKTDCKRLTLHCVDVSPSKPGWASEYISMVPKLVDDLEFVKTALPPAIFVHKYQKYDYAFNLLHFWNQPETQYAKFCPDLAVDFDYPFEKPEKQKIREKAVVFNFGDKVSAQTWAGAWEVAHWVQLVNVLAKKGYQCFGVGSDADRQLTDQIKDMGASLVNLVGNISLKQALELILGSSLFIATTSGLSTITAWLGHPTLTLWPGPDAKSSLSGGMHWAGIKEGIPTYQPLHYTVGLREVTKAAGKLLKLGAIDIK